jgi:membrane-associated phospholipid phosphatase
MLLPWSPLRSHATTAPPVWHTWLMDTIDELRPPSPVAPSHTEVGELLDLRDRRTADIVTVIEKWNSAPAVMPWTNTILDLVKLSRPSPIRAARALALLHAALSDAAVAAKDAQEAYQRPGPQAIEPAIEPYIVEGRWSFPSEHAAVAAAAGVVLGYLFPSESSELFAKLADEAATSRLWAGANFRSDVEAGTAIGRQIGERAVQRARDDGADALWDGSGRLTGDGYWIPTPPRFVKEPLDPLGGRWRPWILDRGDAFRPGPPPTYASPAWRSELTAVRDAVALRTPEQEDAALFWSGNPGSVTPAGLWVEIAGELILRDDLDTPHAARVLALTSVAMADAFVCCWDAKFTYWTARPITADPTLDVLIPTPPFPSYTSGHSTISAAAATVLGYLFPGDADTIADQAVQAKNSRLWAGIHFPIDNDMGAVGGGQVGRLVIEIAGSDGG